MNVIQDEGADNVFGNRNLNKLLDEAYVEQTCVTLRNIVETGFLRTKQMLPEVVQYYCIFRSDMSIFKGFVPFSQTSERSGAPHSVPRVQSVRHIAEQ